MRVPHPRQPTHYVPIDRSRHPDVAASPSETRVYDAANLPLRSHEPFMQQAHEVQFVGAEAVSEACARTYGIKGIPALSSLSSLPFPGSFPYDFMHLIWENVLKNLMLLWSGGYGSTKGLMLVKRRMCLQLLSGRL